MQELGFYGVMLYRGKLRREKVSMFFSGLGDPLLPEVPETQISSSPARVTKPDAGSAKCRCMTVSQRCTNQHQTPFWFKNLFH